MHLLMCSHEQLKHQLQCSNHTDQRKANLRQGFNCSSAQTEQLPGEQLHHAHDATPLSVLFYIGHHSTRVKIQKITMSENLRSPHRQSTQL